MPDSARSDDPAVQAQLDRLAALSPGADILGLDRIERLLERLGNPERALPPVFHVAGTNGKGSVCAFLRAAAEAAGLKAHVYSSPHLVRFNERIRIAGKLIADEDLADVLEEVLNVAGGSGASFFEVTTAAAFLTFARTPADIAIIEVGLGGRLDATNVLPCPAVCGIAQLGLDHAAFLGDTVVQVAGEKAGIAKRGVPLVTQAYPAQVAQKVGRVAAAAGGVWLPRGEQWDARREDDHILYRDASGATQLPLPRLPGVHQAMNAGLAVAMVRHQREVSIPASALRAAMGWAEWPARLQKLGAGPLKNLLPRGAELWLDGGHNPSAARAVADFFRGHVPAGRPLHIIFGLLANKDAPGVLKPFSGRSVVVHALPIPGHEHHAPASLADTARAQGLKARAAANPADALRWIARHTDGAEPPVALIMGSLYLAGEVLRENEQIPH